MDLVLQIWGGGCYLLNKMLFAVSEGRVSRLKHFLKLLGWAVYIGGVPAWVTILISKGNWIAASVEAGGLPAMLLGFYTVYRRAEKPAPLPDRIASLCTYAAILFGVGYSLVENGGIRAFSQILEIGVTVGFLLGSYLLAKKNRSGWLFFMLMNGSMGLLMGMQGKPLLAVQQLASLCFVIYGFAASGENSAGSAAEVTAGPRR